MDFSGKVNEEIAKHCAATESTAIGNVSTPECESCGFLTKAGRILKAMTYPGQDYATIIVLSSGEGIHPGSKEDRRRLIAFISDVNDWLDYGSLIFTQGQEEICYKTAQIVIDKEAISPVLAFMLEQHERNFGTIAEIVKVLFGDMSKEPGRLAEELRSALQR
jgi:hypothetical protein